MTAERTVSPRKICEKCKHYTPDRHGRQFGDCAKAGDYNDEGPISDGVVGWDFEGYRAGVYVGPKFGCIHWERK